MISESKNMHPKIQDLVDDDNAIFVADGTDMLSNVEEKAVCVIFEEPSPEPGDARFYAHVEDLKNGGSDGWYGVVDELSSDATVEDLGELFAKGTVGEYGEVYKDTYGLADKPTAEDDDGPRAM